MKDACIRIFFMVLKINFLTPNTYSYSDLLRHFGIVTRGILPDIIGAKLFMTIREKQPASGRWLDVTNGQAVMGCSLFLMVHIVVNLIRIHMLFVN
jgi:hypothetical protein